MLRERSTSSRRARDATGQAASVPQSGGVVFPLRRSLTRSVSAG
jgi:hypothetical protein